MHKTSCVWRNRVGFFLKTLFACVLLRQRLRDAERDQFNQQLTLVQEALATAEKEQETGLYLLSTVGLRDAFCVQRARSTRRRCTHKKSATTLRQRR